MKLLLLILPLFLWSASMEELYDLDKEQRQILEMSLDYGKKHNLGYTLAATAWKESQFGKYRVGWTTPDYGIFQINYYTYSKRFAKRIKQSGLTKPQVIKMLTHDFHINAEAALAEYKFWQKSRNWKHAVQSYNDGTHISHKGKAYAEDIAKRVRLLQQFI